MAQVKKLQSGGKFRMSGRELQGQTAIDRLSAVYNGVPVGEREMFHVAQRAILDGNTAEYDPTNNSIIVFDKDNNDITSKYTDTGARTDNSALKKLGEALFQTRDWRFKKSGERMSLVDMSDPNAKVEQSDDRAKLRRGQGFFDYDENDGVKTYRNNAQNADKLQIIRDIEKYHNDTDENRKNRYNMDEWSRYGNDVIAFRNYYNNLSEDERAAYFNDLINRIQNNQLSTADIDTLKLFGFIKQDEENGSGSGNGAGSPLSIHKDWTGDRDATQKTGVGIEKTPDGHWKITGDNIFTKSNWYTGGLNWVPQEFDRGFILNGVLYNENEAYNSEVLRPLVSGWYGARRNQGWRTYYNDLNNQDIRFVGDRIWNNNPEESSDDYYGLFGNNFNPQEQYHEVLTPYLKSKGITDAVDVVNITGNFDNIGNKQVFAYLDKGSWNGIGMPTQRFVVYDPDTGEYSDVTDGLAGARFPHRESFDTSTWEDIKGSRYAKHKEISFKGQKNTIFYGEDGNFYYARKDINGNLVRPVRINNIALLKKILANPNDPTLDNKTWESLSNSSSSDGKNNSIKNDTKILRRIAREKETLRAQWTEAGIPFTEERLQEEAEKIVRSFYHQYGGILKNTLSSTGNIVDTSKSEADITDLHKMNNSDGGLTSWEKAQIGAAIGDLVGVAASFAPSIAGGIAGGAVGVGSSITRLIADIKRDGNDLGDWKRFGTNLLFDLGAIPASLIPGVDNAIRASKFLKTARSLGGTLIKWLGAVGATTSTINIGKKIVNGEKLDSQDLVRFISGIPAGALAGRQIAKNVGYAKLAAQQSAQTSKTLAKELSKKQVVRLKPEGSTDGIKVTLSKEQLGKIISDAGGKQTTVLGKIQELAKSQTGVDISADDAKNVLTKLGARVDIKGRIRLFENHRIKNPFKRDMTVSQGFENPEAKGTLYYIRHPFKRQRAVGLMQANEGQANLLSNMSKGEYLAIINGSKAPGSVSRALADVAMDNPNQFSFALPKVQPVMRVWPWGKEGNLARYYKRLPEEEVLLALPPHQRLQYTAPKLNFKGSGWRQGTETPEVVVTPTSWTPRQLTAPIPPRYTQLEIPFSFKPTYSAPKVELLPTTLFKQGGKIYMAKGGIGGDWFTSKTPNLPNIGDTLRWLKTKKDINKKADITKKGHDLLRSKTFSVSEDPFENYNISLIERKYNKAEKPIEQAEFETSDSNRKLAFNLSKSDRLSELEKDKNAEISAEIAETDNRNRITASKNAAVRTDAANKRMDYLTQLDFQKNAADIIRLAEQHQADEVFGQQMSQAGRDAFNRQLSTNYAAEKRRLDEKEELRIRQAVRDKGYLDKWTSLSDSDKTRFGDIKDYIYSLNQGDYKAIYGPSQKYLDDIAELTRKYTRAYGPNMFFKRGGKNTVRSAQDQIAINSIKQAQRATAKLSDNLMKLLQNLLAK